jgi:hypothetical protein
MRFQDAKGKNMVFSKRIEKKLDFRRKMSEDHQRALGAIFNY